MTESVIREGFISLITPDLYLVIAAVFGICHALKSARFFDDRFIPLAAIVLGAVFELLYFVAVGGNAVEFILRGVVAGMAAVYVANIIKQIGSEKRDI